MSRKLWLGLISVFAIFISLQIISSIHKRNLEEAQSNAPEVIVDMSTLNASSLAKALEKDEANIAKKEESVKPAKVVKPVKAAPKLPASIEEVQRALKAAGFNPGKIDGKLGEKTKTAIRAFQKAHDLKVDGKAGVNTWRLLKKYLEN